MNGAMRGTRLDTPHDWTFSGVLLSQAQYQALDDWVQGHGMCHLYDHLGREFLVRLKAFQPVRAPRAKHPWRHTYKCIVTTYAVLHEGGWL
jgi:hypothetical protein